MPKGLPFSVDTWNHSSVKKRHHFLTHAHKDHSNGISTHFSYPIYSTDLTKTLVIQQHPQLDKTLFVGIEVGETVVINDPDGSFSVTAYDANHCPGAVMFLFEGNFGNILHTGDCRLTPECLQNLPAKYIGKKGTKPNCRLDYVFLDCTFGKFSLKIPSKHLAVQQVIKCIWKHPKAPVVYLACDLLGQEEILASVSRTFGSKIFVNKFNDLESYQALKVIYPEILSEDPSSRFHLFGFAKLYERANAKIVEAQAKSQLEPLIIRPSAQWYACDDYFLENDSRRNKRSLFNEAVRDKFGVWHVCYSMHSSRDELEWAVEILAPKWVVSTTPRCRATELNYVKKNQCFGSEIESFDPLWKLLDIDMEAALDKDVSVKCVNLSPVRILTAPEKLVNLSPPSERLPVTLFGRARLGDSAFPFLHDNSETGKGLLSRDETGGESESAVPVGKKTNVIAVQCDNLVEGRVEVYKSDSCSSTGSVKSLNENVRKLYRSMNVPVPRPLPSLVALMNTNKRVKRSFKF